MNGVEEIRMSKWEALEKYREYRVAAKRHPLPYMLQLKSAYNQLRRGHGVIDVFKAMKMAGVNEDGEPKLAIMDATEVTCWFKKIEKGSGQFQSNGARWSRRNPVLVLEAETFPEWEKEKTSWGTQIRREIVSCKVPIVPAHLMPKSDLSNYQILWEVEKWNKEPPRDPMLLRRLGANLFAVVATWDLTPLERAVIAGRVR